MLELPKALRDALENLASADDVQAIDQAIRASLENITEGQEPFELDLDDTINIADWKEGVEELSKVPEAELWRRLGLPNQMINLFQEWTDPNCIIAPWSEDGKLWLCDPSKGRVQLRPRWHQLVGILRILECAFQGEPVLLMDGVGIGKTLQVVGAIACLAFYHKHYSRHNCFPGIFGKRFTQAVAAQGDLCFIEDRKFGGKVGNIPDIPHIIVCPVNLKEQWQREMERFLIPHSFDILPYAGKLSSREQWWTTLYEKSNHAQIQRIILATNSVSLRDTAGWCVDYAISQAIQDDATRVFRAGLKAEAGRAIPNSRFQAVSPSTVYGHEFGFFVLDEAHSARKHNLAHMAARALREKSKVMVAMTATPVTTKPQVRLKSSMATRMLIQLPTVY